jgi:dihydrolipoamide dehydrogenase
MRYTKIAIIGAGTAGLSARREVARLCDDYLVIDPGPFGTTCARVGCMPSKVLIQVAHDVHRRHAFEQQGIHGADGVRADGARVMQHVRSLRDRFVRAVLSDFDAWSDKLVEGSARFEEKNVLVVGEERIHAEKIIIATGSSPAIPPPWQAVRHLLLDTDEFFELTELPRSMLVIGAGVIGLELGQALARLGTQVDMISLDKTYGGLSDPALQDYAHEALCGELSIHLSGVDSLSEEDGNIVAILKDGTRLRAERALVSVGRRPNIAGLSLERAGIAEPKELPPFSTTTFRVSGAPVYLAGDVNGSRPLLHEAADEGRIAGFNAVRDEDTCFQRRVGLTVTFSDPNICLVGESHRELGARDAHFVIGAVSYEGQGRAIVRIEERGLLHVYVERDTLRLLGAEMIAPGGEHLAHMLAWAIAAGMTVMDALRMPFYHPVLEEGLRTAFRNALSQLDSDDIASEMMRCADPPVGVRA